MASDGDWVFLISKLALNFLALLGTQIYYQPKVSHIIIIKGLHGSSCPKEPLNIL